MQKHGTATTKCKMYRDIQINYAENIGYFREKKNGHPKKEAPGVCSLLILSTRSLGM